MRYPQNMVLPRQKIKLFNHGFSTCSLGLMWPVSPAKWVLRRFDHSAIYLLIAGTYTPFLAQTKNVLGSAGLGLGVWLSAAIGMALKLALPGRFDRLAIVLCLLLGWSGVIAYDTLASALPSASLWLLAIGGILLVRQR
jgi:hemolysin III